MLTLDMNLPDSIPNLRLSTPFARLEQGPVAENGILNLMPKFTPEIIHAAIDGFEQQKVRIDAQIAQLREMLVGEPTSPVAPSATAPTKRTVSAAARRRMALGQQRRWAAIKGGAESESHAAPEQSKPKRKLSAAGKAAIAAAQKKRWAARRAEAKKPQATAKKKVGAKRVAVKTAPARRASVRAAAKGAAVKVAGTTPAPAA